MQNDPGSNRNICNKPTLLQNYEEISPIPIGGIKKGQPAIFATGRGLFPWRSNNGDLLLIEMLVCPDADCTLLSPTAIVNQYPDLFYGWTLHCNQENESGILELLNRDGINHSTFSTCMENDLWYHYAPDTNSSTGKAVVHTLSQRASFELWHHRLGHACPRTIENMHKYALGIPKLREPPFYKCGTCLACKTKKSGHGPGKTIVKKPPDPEELIRPGQHLHMDFGFVRGSSWSSKDKDGNLITSIDGQRSYLIIVDRATRYKWVFNTTTKKPPLDEVKSVLQKFKPSLVNLHCTVRTDQGGELGKSNQFRKLVKEFGYIYEPTGSQASSQNGLAEKPNQDIKNMTRSLLHASGLGSEYWSYAMNHSVYLSNRLYHSTMKMTPYQKLHHAPPSLRHLRVFGSKVYYKHTRKNQKNMDLSTDHGIFLGYTSTEKNVYIKSSSSNNILIGTHTSFDESHMSSPSVDQPPMAQALRNAGYNNDGTSPSDHILPVDRSGLKVQLLSKDAKAPERGTLDSAGLDVCCTEDLVIEPHSYATTPLDIAVQCRPGTYAQLQERSSLAIKGLTLAGGVIDSDYRGNIHAIPINNSDVPIVISKGQKFAQLIVKNISLPTVEIVGQLTPTERGSKGFGSTNKKEIGVNLSPSLHDSQFPIRDTYAAAAATANADKSYDLFFSDDPFDNQISIEIDKKGKHPTLGLDLNMCPDREQPRLLSCAKGEPAGKIKKWRTNLRGSYILAVNGVDVKTISDVERQIKASINSPVSITFGTMDKISMHPQDGVPQLYFDQLHKIGEHLFQLKHDPQWSIEYSDTRDNHTREDYSTYLSNRANVCRKNSILFKNRRRSNKLTRSKLRKRNDWEAWKRSEHKQLDQYESQAMFGTPCPRPPNANTLPFLWTYVIKSDGTLKARGVCNGSKSQSGLVTLGNTYAGSLDHTGARIFWATAALKNLTVFGADVSNAFAEAPPPKDPLYMTIDKPFREWWESKKRDPIPQGYVLPVQKAIQGHPEAPRLWQTLIHSILINDMKLNPTTHEPCLYSGTFQDKQIYFLRQVDDFAIACESETIAKEFVHAIDNKMSISIKYLGLLTRFNGVDIEQTQRTIKIHSETYIKKILREHDWLDTSRPCHTFPIPIKSEATYSRTLEQAKPPTLDKDKFALQREMKFNYRQAIGELIYCMVTTRPDISFPLIKLSQYSTNPAREHYDAVKEIFHYLACTINDGIHYWRPSPEPSLEPSTESFDVETTDSDATIQDQSHATKSASDADWGGDTNHRRSVTGFVVKLAGGAVYYKTRFQPVIALSSTEAEFYAATEAGKSILYIRSILQEINLEQTQASVLHIDNNGALNMANQRQPTKSTRHIDIRQFAIQDWVESDLLLLRRICSASNYSDALTKPMGRTLHHRHMDYIMGRVCPTYADV